MTPATSRVKLKDNQQRELSNELLPYLKERLEKPEAAGLSFVRAHLTRS